MIDLEMMASLLGTLPPQALPILLGDKDQLASVEAGAMLGDPLPGCRGGLVQRRDPPGCSGSAAKPGRACRGSAQAPSRWRKQTVMLRHSRRFRRAADRAPGADWVSRRQGRRRARARTVRPPTSSDLRLRGAPSDALAVRR
ncbi:hypothetical protein ACPA9J_27990 [Pseudomonas aeruginosa]